MESWAAANVVAQDPIANPMSRATAMQRLLPMTADGRTHPAWHLAVIGLSDGRWPKCRRCEAPHS